MPPPPGGRTRDITQVTPDTDPGAASRFPFQQLDVYRAARELATLVHRLGIADGELRDQATRAAKSAFLNLCEGLKRGTGREHREHARGEPRHLGGIEASRRGSGSEHGDQQLPPTAYASSVRCGKTRAT